MTANLLSLNDSKTQYLPIVPKSATRLLDGINVIRIGDNTVTAATTVRNLGVHFDRHLDMNSQTSHVISACSYHLRNINHISRYLPTTTKERVINALIILDLTIATLFSITLQPTIYRVFNGSTMRQRGLFCVVPELTGPRLFSTNFIGYQSRVGFNTRFYSSPTK